MESAIHDGTLQERHWFDAKSEIGKSDSSKKEIAKDLAAFANDGGVLIVGIVEDRKTQTMSVQPLLLDGLAESIDQIARSRCDPPLYVICHPLADPTGPDEKARGVLLVEVPRSPSAPHMVADRYWGRSDKTNYAMSDREVASRHALRTMRQHTAEQLIATEVERDPIRGGQLSHLYVVAQPLASPPDLLGELMDRPEELGKVVRETPSLMPQWWHTLLFSQPRANGYGFHSNFLSGRQLATDGGAGEVNVLDLEIDENGRIALLYGGASIHDNAAISGGRYVNEINVVTLTRAVVSVAGRLAGSAGYGGSWLLAVGISDLRGKVSFSAWREDKEKTTWTKPAASTIWPPFSATYYVQGTEAMTVELLDQPGTISRRLLRRLLRAIGSYSTETIDELLAEHPKA